MDIAEQSKILAEYLGWKYIPSNDLQGFPKAGWWKFVYKKNSQGIIPAKLLMGASNIDNEYYKYVCRNHHELRFYNSMDWLIKILDKLTKEDLSEHMYSWERCVEGDEEDCETGVFMNIDYYISVEFGTIIEINPAMEIGRCQGEDIVKNTFNACVEAVEYINKRKHIL